jgi:tRNA-specific 2-thiouridylase
MSGGVDSSVAAWLLKNQGYDVVGLTMQIWDGAIKLPDTGRTGCYGPGETRDLESARTAAARLGIPHIAVPLADQYKRYVLDYFRAEYRAGRTPNPCVVCNQRLKFGFLLDRAREQGIAFDFFATGHYARVVRDDVTGYCRLLRGVDHKKDQSYFLARLTQEQLRQVLFPLGELTKTEVIRLARDAGFGDIAAREESQDFVECDDYSALFQPADNRPGQIVDTAGHVLGQHNGIIHYTIGQREGLKLGGQKRPLYVIGLDAPANRVIVGHADDLLRTEFEVTDCNWLAIEPLAGPLEVTVKIRYNHKRCPAKVVILIPQSREKDLSRARVYLDQPQRAVSPGQAAVFYQDDLVIGSGWIC